MRIPARVLGSLVKSMKPRCIALKAAGDKDFEE
jgi:hypothetical protein